MFLPTYLFISTELAANIFGIGWLRIETEEEYDYESLAGNYWILVSRWFFRQYSKFYYCNKLIDSNIYFIK